MDRRVGKHHRSAVFIFQSVQQAVRFFPSSPHMTNEAAARQTRLALALELTRTVTAGEARRRHAAHPRRSAATGGDIVPHRPALLASDSSAARIT